MQGARPGLGTYNEAFREALRQLNPQQRAAVGQIEGPVLVIAGPGTGKTHILSARIGTILMETDAQANNILCLTFTEAGVQAMRQRLLEFIGPEAHRVHINTFHSFCNGIIQDNLELFGRQDMEPLSELERVEIIRHLLDELPVSHPLRQGRPDAYFYESHLHGLFQLMKAEDWGPELVSKRIDEYLLSLPEREAFIYKVNRGDIRKGSLKEAKLEEAKAKMELLRAAAALFPRYQEAMQQARRYDYDDMILWALQAFENHEALLRSYQEQYLYFLIDEYQDTNGAQNELIRKLAGYWESPNIFIVGDDDQSIYEFQGARLKNLTEFYTHYRESLKLILLQDNYRSSQPILDASRAVIRHNSLRIVNSLQEPGLEKVLVAAHPEYGSMGRLPEVRAYPNLLHEEVDIVFRIRELQEKQVPLEEVAVIYAKHRQAEGLVELLDKYGIPYTTRRQVNVLDLPLVRNLRQMLEYFAAEYQQPHSGAYLLFRMLHYPFFGISPDTLARLSVYMARQPYEQRLFWREVLADEHARQLLSPQERAQLQPFLDFHGLLLREYNHLSAPAFVERLINRSGLLRHILGQEDKAWLLQAVKAFLDFTKAEAARNPRLTIGRLLDLLKNMDAHRIPMALHKNIQTPGGLQLLTAHSAKGLEFRHVFLLGCTSNHWEPRSRGSSYQFSLPDTLTFSGEEDPLEARRRLFYVAMTRAKEGLYLSYSEEDYAGKALRPALFVEELRQEFPLEVDRKSLSADALLEAETLRMQESELPVLPAREEGLIDALLEGFQLSVSAMHRYLQCPLAFYYENVLRAPVFIREAAHYGIAMHNALQRLFDRMKAAADKQFLPEAAFIRLFRQEMERRQAFFSRKEYPKRLEAGVYNLTTYYQRNLPDWHKEVLVEHRPRQVEVDGVPITGSIDKLELYGTDKARIVDYKTGSQNDARMRRPTEANPHGGSYWRQLVFYKLLYEGHPANSRRVQSGLISYLEPDKRGNFIEKEVHFTPDDVLAVRRMIAEVYGKIQARDFYTGCGRTSCSWCNFVRHNGLVDSFSEPEVEELDD